MKLNLRPSDDAVDFLMFAGGVVALIVVVFLAIGIPLSCAEQSHDRELGAACEKRGGHWTVTGNSQHDGDISACLDREGRPR